MATITTDHDSLKRIIKEAVVEVLSERPEILASALIETLEDIGLAEAIRQGQQTEEVPFEEVEAILRGDA